VLIIFSQPNTDRLVRISVDVWMKQLFTLFGVNAVSFSLFLVLLIGIFILSRERAKLASLKFKYLPILILESVAYAIIVAYISSLLTNVLLNFSTSNTISGLTYLQKLALSLGAGLYEELFFRVLLVSLFILIFNKIFTTKRWASVTVAVVLSAFFFSAVHYTGTMGDFFTIHSFLYRFIFGLILSGIYVVRGFGVAAWTHALYDVLVITFF
jgi:membrane protease YdiL (CAAX protease family)